ncbi:MAG: SpoIIE family protein phosphatase [Pseudomonadota bacterium]
MKLNQLRYRVLLWVLPFILVPLMAGGLLSGGAAEEELVALAERQLASVTTSVTNYLHDSARHLHQDLYLIAHSPELKHLLAYQEFEMPREARVSQEALGLFLLDYSRAAPAYLQLRYLNQGDRELVRVAGQRLAEPELAPDHGLWADWRPRGPYQAAALEHNRILGVRRLPASGELALTALRLVHGSFHQPRREHDYAAWGLVVLDLDWARLLDYLAELKGVEVVILDPQGRLLADRQRMRILQNSPAELALVQDLAGSRQASRQVQWEGVQYLCRAQEVDLGGGLRCFVLVRAAWDTIMRPSLEVREIIIWVTVACLVLAVAGIFYVSGVITRPIQDLALHTQKVAAGDFEARVREPGTYELAQLARAFNRMGRELSGHIEDLRRVTAEKERLAGEMAIAARLQRSVLPEAPPRLNGWDLAGGTIPAEETGGDFFDYLELPGGRWGLLVADVAGKGLPAALVMLAARAYLRTLALEGQGPRAVMEGANRLLAVDNARSVNFVTAFYAELDPERGTILYVNAGHNPALLLTPAGDAPAARLALTGIPLGIRPDETYEVVEAALPPGGILAIYSDGVTEAPNPNDEQYGEERLEAALRRLGALGAAAAWQGVRSEALAWAGDQPQFDDLTLLILRRLS